MIEQKKKTNGSRKEIKRKKTNQEGNNFQILFRIRKAEMLKSWI